MPNYLIFIIGCWVGVCWGILIVALLRKDDKVNSYYDICEICNDLKEIRRTKDDVYICKKCYDDFHLQEKDNSSLDK